MCVCVCVQFELHGRCLIYRLVYSSQCCHHRLFSSFPPHSLSLSPFSCRVLLFFVYEHNKIRGLANRLRCIPKDTIPASIDSTARNDGAEKETADSSCTAGILQHFKKRAPKLKQSDSKSVVQTRGGGTAHVKALQYFDTSTLKRVLELVAIDYVRLNMSLPSWTADVVSPENLEETPSTVQCVQGSCPELVRMCHFLSTPHHSFTVTYSQHYTPCIATRCTFCA